MFENYVVYRGRALQLIDNFPARGIPAPPFHVHSFENDDRSTYSLADFLTDKQPLLFATMASIDTPVSVLETLTLENKLKNFFAKCTESNVDISLTAIVVTSDLPFTLNRFSREHNLQNVTLLSDYFDQSLGTNYGLLFKHSRILTRSMFVIDSEGELCHFDAPPDYEQQPDIDAAIEAIAELEGVTNAKT
jgi:thiol peroxidase